MDVTDLVSGIEASWFHPHLEEEGQKAIVVFRMDLVFRNVQQLGEFLSKASLQILSNEELHFLNKEFHEVPSITKASDGPH
jgi:hypothetical protein